MKELHIECAGAGKTFGIAQKIISIIADCPGNKKIYAITHTHYAVKQIKDELIEAMKVIPDNVVIETIHSFLLNNIIYPFSCFVKADKINSCSIEPLPNNNYLQSARKKELKTTGSIHSKEVYRYAKTILVEVDSDKAVIKKRKEIALNYFVSDIFCLFVDEAQDMDEWFFRLMIKVIQRLEHFYFVGDPFQALWATDKYSTFTELAAEQEHVKIITNFVSRRIPICIVPLCNKILPVETTLRSISEEMGVVEYTLLSELEDETIKKLGSGHVFSYIKNETDVFSTSNESASLPEALLQSFAEKYQSHDIGALRLIAISKIRELGLDSFLKMVKIRLSKTDYAKFVNHFREKEIAGVLVESIHKIKGLEDDTAYFIICNSLLEVLLGIKNDFNRETNLLYVALTRTKRRLLFIVDDDEGMKRNFQKRKIDIGTAMDELGISKAVTKDWFDE